MNWLPIETAPNDKPILLHWETARDALRGRWVEDEKFYSRPKDWASPRAGWKNDGDQVIPRNQNACKNWMPLPELPKD